MKLTMRLPTDNKAHTYCPHCMQETLQSIKMKGQQYYRCSICSYFGPRALIIDPAIRWWVDQNNEYCHEASGIFLFNTRREFLFFERNTFPFGTAVPAGHVDRDEDPLRAAQRELKEETAVSLSKRAFRHINTNDFYGDKCRRGADMHRWHSFACALPPSARIKVDPREGKRPVWLTLNQALRRPALTFATRKAIEYNGRRILAATR